MRLLSAMTFGLVLGLAEPAPAGEFAFESLSQVIAEQHVGSVEELIAALPEDLRAHYSLVFSSRSLQDASFEHPRAVLFGSSAQLILTFNGDPSQHGFEAVETMEFDSHANRFIFREITFSSDRTQPAARISGPNPARCVACHDHPARPIWDVPPAWPGIYGERYGAGLSSMALRGFRRFLAIQATHPRYRHLARQPWPTTDTPMCRFASGTTAYRLSRRMRDCPRGWRRLTCGPLIGFRRAAGLLRT
jgi:hypothetical protein